MRLKLIYILLLAVLSSSLYANYDEKQILLKNATNMIKVRKYNLAEELYQEALTKFPDDKEVVIAFLELYVRTNKAKEGLSLLKEKSNSLAPQEKAKYEITFMLMVRTFDLAYQIAEKYLQVNSSQNDYKDMGNLFQRYRAYGQSIDILLAGDELFPHQFSFEIADSYYFDRNYSDALKFYLKALEHDVGSSNLINSRIRNIIKQSPNSITALIEHFGTDSDLIEVTKDNKSTIDVYVHALLTTGYTETALEILDKYQAKDIYTKAEQFKRLKEYEISDVLYQLCLDKVEDLRYYYRYTFNYAQMLFESSSYLQADSLVNIIIIEDSNQNLKRNILFDAYLLKADITFREKATSKEYEDFLKDAEKFAYNNNQKIELKARLSYFKLLQEDYNQAERYLEELAGYGKNSNYFFNYYLYEVFQNGTFADSVATELIILAPESDFTIEMLDLKYILKSLKSEEKNLFLDAYRKDKLFLHEEADSLYQQLYESTSNEYFVIKNALMNIEYNNILRAQELFSRSFEDDFVRDFAAVQLVLLEDDKTQLAQDMARNFLTQYPNSSLAAKVRQILNIDQNK